MKRKVTIVGTGHVGIHVASALLTQEVCQEIAMIDIKEGKAKAEATDLFDASSYIQSDARIYEGSNEDYKDSDIIVMSACGAFFTEDRLNELDETKRAVGEALPHIKASGFKGVIVSISNPCDIIAQFIKNETGLNVVGTGTMLDSSRLKSRLGKALNVSPSSVNGYMLGEHGNSQFAAYSLTSINGIALDEYLRLNNIEIDLEKIERNVREAGWEIVQGKGSTEFGIGAAAAFLIKAILNDENKVLPCSTYIEEYGVYTSVPCIIGKDGVKSILKIELPSDEQEKFENSCNVLKENLKRL